MAQQRIDPPTMEEDKATTSISKDKNNKAPGEDSVTVELIRNGGQTVKRKNF
jgi:hypothetical protein